MKSRKAQYAFEFLVVFAFLTLLFLVWMKVYFEMKTDIVEKGKDSIVEAYGSSLADKLFFAAQVNPGYSDEVIVKDNIEGINIDELYLDKNTLVIEANSNNYYFDVPCAFVNIQSGCGLLQPTPGAFEFDIKARTINVENKGFSLILNPVIPSCQNSPCRYDDATGSFIDCQEMCP